MEEYVVEVHSALSNISSFRGIDLEFHLFCGRRTFKLMPVTCRMFLIWIYGPKLGV
jgi:hypothetical protein